jgi:hypothetical protein
MDCLAPEPGGAPAISRGPLGVPALVRITGSVLDHPASRSQAAGWLGIGLQADLSGIENTHLAGALVGCSHDVIQARLGAILDFLLVHCDRRAWLDAGRIVARATVAAACHRGAGERGEG